jgi:hypothetical protein
VIRLVNFETLVCDVYCIKYILKLLKMNSTSYTIHSFNPKVQITLILKEMFTSLWVCFSLNSMARIGFPTNPSKRDGFFIWFLIVEHKLNIFH